MIDETSAFDAGYMETYDWIRAGSQGDYPRPTPDISSELYQAWYDGRSAAFNNINHVKEVELSSEDIAVVIIFFLISLMTAISIFIVDSKIYSFFATLVICLCFLITSRIIKGIIK